MVIPHFRPTRPRTEPPLAERLADEIRPPKVTIEPVHAGAHPIAMVGGKPADQTSVPEQDPGPATATITIELFGVPRLRAGTGRVTLALPTPTLTLDVALDRLGHACPSLDGAVIHRGTIRPGYRVSLNGDRFLSDPETRLTDGDVLLLLAADVGG